MTEPSREPALLVRDLQVSYGPIRAVQGIDLDVPARTVTALVGSNGAGKSSTLRAIAGLVPARSTTITAAGTSIATATAPGRVRDHGVVLVPEGRSVFSTMTVAENLALGTGVGRHRQRRHGAGGLDLPAVHDLFPVLAERTRQRAQYLSGGEQQMLSIARSLLMHPKVLLIDEPSMGLAPQLVTRLFDVLRAVLLDQDLAVLLVEQDTAVALDVASTAYVIERGRVSVHAPTGELRTDPRLVAAYLGGDYSATPAAASPPGMAPGMMPGMTEAS
jgi:branched-chain amino acid transport system ATP-binding protein